MLNTDNINRVSAVIKLLYINYFPFNRMQVSSSLSFCSPRHFASRSFIYQQSINLIAGAILCCTLQPRDLAPPYIEVTHGSEVPFWNCIGPRRGLCSYMLLLLHTITKIRPNWHLIKMLIIAYKHLKCWSIDQKYQVGRQLT